MMEQIAGKSYIRGGGKLGAWILGLLAFFAMMPVVGIAIGRLMIPFFVLLLPFYFVWGLFHERLNRKRMLIVGITVGWFAFTALVNGHGPNNFGKSLAAFILCMLPFMVSEGPHFYIKPVIVGFLGGLMAVFLVGSLDLLASLSSLPRPQEYLPFPGWALGGTYEVAGINRVRALCGEPSGLGRQMVFALAILTFYQPRSKNEAVIGLIFRIFCVVFLFLTFSLSGLLLLTTFVVVFYWRRIFTQSGLLKFAGLALFVAISGIIVFSVQDDLSLSKIYGGYADRIGRGIEDVRSGTISSSTGMRLQSIIAPIFYIKDQGFSGLAIGEGYANQEYWVYLNFAFDTRSGLSSGILNNIFSVIFISTGLLGFSLYLMLIYSFSHRSNRLSVLAVIVVFHFSTGLLLYFDMWFLLYLMGGYAAQVQARLGYV